MDFSKLSIGAKYSMLAVAILMAGTVAAVIGSQQSQENRSRASGPTPPVVEASTSTRAGSVSSVTLAHPMTTNANRLLIVGVSSYGSGSISSVTYGGSPLTRAVSKTSNNSVQQEVWYLAPVNITGNNNIVVNFSNKASSVVVGATSFSNVDQSSPLGYRASVSTTSSTPNITASGTNTNQLVMNILTSYNASATANAGQSQLWNSPGANSYYAKNTLGAASVRQGVSGSTALGWALSASRTWIEVVIAINGATPSGPTFTPTPTNTPTPTYTPTPTPTPGGPTPTPTPVVGDPVVCVGCSPRDVLVRLNSSGFINANLTRAILTQSGLNNQDFTGASFVEAVWAAGHGGGSNFTNADFTRANLNSTSFSPSNFTGANLTQADLTAVNLQGVTMTGANVTGVIWNGTTCPDGTNSDDNGNTCVGHLNP